jgi:hypothetical protein
MKRLREKALLLLAAAFIGVGDASADTIYDFSSGGEVTFNFDTTGFTGTVSIVGGQSSGLVLGGVPTFALSPVGDYFQTGTTTISSGFASFTFSDGVITDWSVHHAFYACGYGYLGCALDISGFGLDGFGQIVGICGLLCSCAGYFGSCPPPALQSVFFTQIEPAPGPVIGAGLPGLIFAAGGPLLAWWRRRRKAA